MAPQEIAHYRITGKLGAGGMGEVYRATDSKLGREVAIKVLPASFANDSERMSRFTREARVLASLNHPNIAAIHGVEDAAGARALIMELVEGQTLGDRIDDRPLPVADALAIARQIAEALDYAHQCGVIHRDLKPANIKITPDGVVKVLDFGLAKALSGDQPAAQDPAVSPTLTLSQTQVGVLLGTAAYMSPEQARGIPADKRADVWSFGAVLFEMLSGRLVFPGETVSDSLASVLKSDPDWTLLPPDLPASLRRLLRRCLQRDRKLRLRDIGDAIAEIDEALTAAPEPAAPPAKRRYPVWLAGLAAASLLTAAVLGFLLSRRNAANSSTPGVPVRFRGALPAGRSLISATHSSNVALSADGSRIAFVASRDGVQELFHRALDASEATAVSGLTGALKAPFLSPDGQWVGIFNDGKLRKAPTAGGPVETVCDAPSGHGGAWNRRGLIVFSASHTSGLSSVSESGGAVKPLTLPKFEAGESGHVWPVFLPDDRTVLFTAIRSVGATYDGARIDALNVQTGERRMILERGYAARYLSSGHLLYMRGGVLMLAPFDAAELRLTGPATKVLSGVRVDPLGPPDYDVAPAGVLVFAPGDPFVPESRLALIDRSGKVEDLAEIKEPLADGPAFSPEGDRIAFVAGNEQTDIFVYDLKRRVLTRLTNDGTNDSPAWLPDGRGVAFVSTKGGGSSIFTASADGSGAPALVTRRNNRIYSVTVVPGGESVAFSEYDPRTLFDIYLAPVTGGAVRPLFSTPAFEWQPAFAPNGRAVAYIMGGASGEDVYIQGLDGRGKWRATTGGASNPVWSRDGRELFYLAGRALYAVSVASGDDPKPGPPRVVMQPVLPNLVTTNRAFDVARDGRLVISRPASIQPPATTFEVVVNWRPSRTVSFSP